MWEGNSYLQPPTTTQLVGLQLLVCFWKESPPGVQGVAKRIRGRLEQAAEFVNQEALRVANISPSQLLIRLVVHAMER